MTKRFIEDGGIATLDQLQEVCKKEKIDSKELLRKLEEAECVITPEKVKDISIRFGRKMLFAFVTPRPQYNMIKYSSYYCKIDVQVLKDGWRKFRDLILDKYQSTSATGIALLQRGEVAVSCGGRAGMRIPRAALRVKPLQRGEVAVLCGGRAGTCASHGQPCE